MTESILTKKQTKQFTKRNYNEDGEKIVLNIRYDDECGNGYNTFAMTADIYSKTGRWEAGGCQHEEIAKAFPEFAKYIKWHLVSSCGPLHYVANTIYHATNTDLNGYKKGEPCGWEKVLKFEGFPITFKYNKDFLEFISNAGKSFEIEELEYTSETGYKYSNKYTFKGFANRWHDAPFDTLTKAQEMKEALETLPWSLVEVVTEYSRGKERDLKKARACGLWEDATEEELMQEPEVLEKLLMARLPALMAEFKKDIEELGFVF